MTKKEEEALVAAVRADELVGEGTDTAVAEAWSDEELAEFFRKENVHTSWCAVMVARGLSGLGCTMDTHPPKV